ncbi:MAG: hypothetical protein KIT72_16305 [Polyangiaceae bacterium]|nr:hypothetical protein [Polyangiaceae bacterium]MCW5791981.1 hypothetical protein [Polyangiaceae bacterium]
MSWSRFPRAALLALPLLCSAGVALAAPAPDASARATPSALRLVLQTGTHAVDAAAISQAVERELGIPVQLGAGAAADTLSFDWVSSPGHVVASFVDAQGRRTARTIARPEPAATPEVLALLAGNLVRNEARALLAQLAGEGAAKQGEGDPGGDPEGAVDAASEGSVADESAVGGASPAAEEKDSKTDGRSDAEGEGSEAAEGSPPALRPGALHLSLFHPIALDSHSESLSVSVELGLFYSYIGETRVLSFNPLVSRHEHGATGLHLGGLVAWAGGEVQGLQLGGLTTGAGALEGLSLAGVLGYVGGRAEGVQVAGAVGIVKGPVSGFQLAGAASYAGDVEGVQLAGAFSYASFVTGAQLSGGLNVARARVDGLQLSSVNVAGSVSGGQLAAVNVTEQIDGAQIGAVNVARRVSGVQLGAVNVAEEVDGLAIGVVSLAKNGRQQPMAWVSAGQRSHLGVSLEVGPIYSVPYVGADLWGDEQRFEWGYHLGLKARLGPAWGAIDAGYGSEQERLDTAITPIERARALLGVEVVPRTLTLFAGAGTRTTELKDLTVESHFGIQVF